VASGDPDAPDVDPGHPRTRWRFELLGRFTVRRDGAALADRDVGSRKGRLLLKVLLVHADAPVSAGRLGDILWGDDPPANVARNLASLVSRLRAVFGAHLIEGGDGSYRLSLGPNVELDLVEVERLAEEARARLVAGEPGLAAAATERALDLIGATTVLADEPDSAWTEPARARVTALRGQLRRHGCQAAADLDDEGTVIRLAGDALRDDPFDEGAGRALMRAHQRRGDSAEGLRVFERLRTVLANELGVDPSPATREVHRALLREEAPPSETIAEQRRSAPPTEAEDRGRGRGAGLVGRDAELERLRRWWVEATGGRPRLVLIAGEAGIGKTRLAEELVATAETTGGATLQARCYEAERSLFLGPVVEVLNTLIGRMPPDRLREDVDRWGGPLAGLVPSVVSVLGPQEHEPSTPDVERRRIFEAASTLLRRTSLHRPLLVLLDDLHNAGASSLELLHYLLRHAADSRLLVVATSRVEEGSDALRELAAVSERLDLGPLPDDAVSTLVRHAGARRFESHILAATRGHTLSVVETLQALAEVDGELDAPPVPASLEVAVQRRLERAGPDVEELLRGAATLGSTFGLQVVAQLLDLSLEDAVRRTERALGSRLVVEDGTRLAFSNDLIQQIIYDTTPAPVRVARHARAAELLDDHPEAVGDHASAAQDWPRALTAWLEAADRAAHRYATRDAEQLLERAIAAGEAADDPVGTCRARLARAVTREALADYAGELRDLEAARELAHTAGRPDLEAIALRELGGDVLVGLGRPSTDCLPYLEAGLQVAQEAELGRMEVELLGRIAVIWTNRARFDRGAEAADRALARARQLDDDRALALALDAVKNVSAYTGDLERLAESVPEIERVLRTEDDLRVRQWLQWAEFESVMVPFARADWKRAEATLDLVVEESRRSGHPWRSLYLAHRSWLHRAQGDYGRALEDGRSARDEEVSAGHPWWSSFAAAMLGWLLSDMGAHDDAVELLERGVATSERDGMETYLLRCVSHLALARERAGDRAAAEQALGRAEGLLARVTAPLGRAFLHGAHAYAAVARVRLARREPAEVRRLLRIVRAPAEAVGWHEVVATDRILRGRACLVDGEPERAQSLLEEGTSLARSVGLRPLAWEGHTALAQLALAAGDGGARARHQQAAASQLEAMVGSIADERLRDVLVATSEHGPASPEHGLLDGS
jgi:DNA-binding SARP family transcriptional activator/tetratricopeptide (TPR) repeat protein